jgi:hypothetical protein
MVILSPEGRRRKSMDEDTRPTSTSSKTVPPPPCDPVPSFEIEEDVLFPTSRPCISSPDGSDQPKKPERAMSKQEHQEQKTSPKSVMDVMSVRTRRNKERRITTDDVISLDDGIRRALDIPEN